MNSTRYSAYYGNQHTYTYTTHWIGSVCFCVIFVYLQCTILREWKSAHTAVPCRAVPLLLSHSSLFFSLRYRFVSPMYALGVSVPQICTYSLKYFLSFHVLCALYTYKLCMCVFYVQSCQIHIVRQLRNHHTETRFERKKEKLKKKSKELVRNRNVHTEYQRKFLFWFVHLMLYRQPNVAHGHSFCL